MIEIPTFNTQKELVNFLYENKNRLLAQKKASIKHADAVLFTSLNSEVKESVYKANIAIPETELDSLTELKVRAIINTTNVMDSHLDVHIPGLWKKSLSENRMIMHVREHQSNKFEYIIADGSDLKAYTKNYQFSELGSNLQGYTEALVFDSIVRKNRNPFMFEQYGKGYVRNHSVGMQYVKITMAVKPDSGYNPEYWGAELEAWEKYFPMIANYELANEKTRFWAVTEAKVIEGSAVPLGSNSITPTQENNLKFEPSTDTQKEQIEFLRSLCKEL